MSLEIDGTPGEGLNRQLELAWSNIRRILEEADGSFVRRPNAEARVVALGGRPVPTTAIVVQTLDPEWLVELEVIAAD